MFIMIACGEWSLYYDASFSEDDHSIDLLSRNKPCWERLSAWHSLMACCLLLRKEDKYQWFLEPCLVFAAFVAKQARNFVVRRWLNTPATFRGLLFPLSGGLLFHLVISFQMDQSECHHAGTKRQLRLSFIDFWHCFGRYWIFYMFAIDAFDPPKNMGLYETQFASDGGCCLRGNIRPTPQVSMKR